MIKLSCIKDDHAQFKQGYIIACFNSYIVEYTKTYAHPCMPAHIDTCILKQKTNLYLYMQTLKMEVLHMPIT